MNENQPGPPQGYAYQQGPSSAHPQDPQQPGQPPGPRKRHRVLRSISYVAVGGACLGIGAAIGSSSSSTVTRTVPGPAHTVTVPGPATTVTVPGPATTVTVTPPPPPAGTTFGTWSGTGTQVTPAFDAPASGNYIVSWTYSGNNDPSIGGATNFSISATDPNALSGNLPNDIASSGSGSTEITGVTASQSFNVQATGSWTIKVVTAP